MADSLSGEDHLPGSKISSLYFHMAVEVAGWGVAVSPVSSIMRALHLGSNDLPKVPPPNTITL